MAELLLGQPLFPGESGVDQLVEIIKVLGTPTREEIKCINPNYTEFKFPQIKPHPWQKVFQKRLPPEAVDLVCRFFQYSPNLRCTALEACIHPFFDELRDPNIRLLNGCPLPPLFNFKPQELFDIPPDTLHRLIPEHARRQNLRRLLRTRVLFSCNIFSLGVSLCVCVCVCVWSSSSIFTSFSFCLTTVSDLEKRKHSRPLAEAPPPYTSAPLLQHLISWSFSMCVCVWSSSYIFITFSFCLRTPFDQIISGQTNTMACISYNVGTSVKFFGSHHHRSSRPFWGIRQCWDFRNSSSLFYVKPLNSSSVNLYGPRDSQLFNSSRCFSTVFSNISSDNGMPEERMVVLVIGGGGREHALCYALKRSPSCDGVFCAPGNAGISNSGDATCISDLDTSDSLAVISFCQKWGVGLVVIGPEAPLIAGLANDLGKAGIPTFGPSAEAAALEGSKNFMKNLCDKYGIPTAKYQTFTDPFAAKKYIQEQGAPIVVKADGLAAGKGVIVAMPLEKAFEAVDSMLVKGVFGSAGCRVIVEEFLEDEEASFFALVDGENAIPLESAQDHKRVGDGDTGPNTGGMGAYSPAPILTKELESLVMESIILPTVKGMSEEGCKFVGVLYAGLIIEKKSGLPKLIEYNVRFGDPECQTSLFLSFVRKGINLLQMTWENGMKKNFFEQ
ncbi:hypothetical protein ACSBR1_029650 [Camellia fascicularis]